MKQQAENVPKHRPFWRRGRRRESEEAETKTKKRTLAVLAGALAVCLLAAILGQTYSYFFAKDQIKNHLDLSELTFEIEEPGWTEPTTPLKPGDVIPKDPQIRNTGEMPFVVRVKLQEVWTPKDETKQLETLTNPDLVRYFAANTGGDEGETAFSGQKLLEILAADSGKAEENRDFALRQNLTPNSTNPSAAFWNADNTAGWYRGDEEGTEWLYYNQVVPPSAHTEPVFRAVTIRTAEDAVGSVEDMAVEETGLTPEEITAAKEAAYQEALLDYRAKLAKYNLDIYVYAETVQADSFAWQNAWGDDVPATCAPAWAG